MTTHVVGTRAQWLAARLELLEAEKELTRRGDALARQRQALPWVRVDKDYRFDIDAGSATLAELFRGRSQLLVYHFMFGPDYTAGCPSCSAIADGFNGIVAHLENHDVAFTAVSRAPLAKLQAYRQRMGWTFQWASSFGSEFNSDFAVGFSEAQQRDGTGDYNYRRLPAASPEGAPKGPQTRLGNESPAVSQARACGIDPATYLRELPGMSAFVREGGVVYHSYSAYARGLDALWGMYPWLDRAPLGRNEPAGTWWRRRDEYADAGHACCR